MARFQLVTQQDSNRSLSLHRQDRRTCKSCRLVAHDGPFLFSLVLQNNGLYCIDAHRLPIDNNEDSGDRYYDDEAKNSNNSNATAGIPALVRTELPLAIQNALEIDPPIEILCVEGDSKRPAMSEQERLMPRLILYTRKASFLVSIVYNCNDDDHGDVVVVEGEVASSEEPLERYLSEAYGLETSIVRIRSAPQCRSGYTTIAPATCFAALLENRATNEFTLVLHHGNGLITEPLQFGVEYGLEATEQFTDFCFAKPCGELSLFPSLSIVLLKGSGEVFTASPIVFDGSVTTKAIVQEGHEYLQLQMDRCSDRNTAKWRRCKAASRFLIDVFDKSENKNNFCTASVLFSTEQSASNWPVKLQGPLLGRNDSLQNSFISCVIENFGSSDYLVGLAIGKVAGEVDFAALSPTCLLPRFAYESMEDSHPLDDSLPKQCSMLARAELSLTAVSTKDLSSVSIVQDPVVDTLLHYATQDSVCTISTNALRVANRKIRGEKTNPVRTSAWKCLDSSEALLGVVVATDVLRGHMMIAGLQSGALETVDVTEIKYEHEFDHLFQKRSSSGDALVIEDSTSTLLCEELGQTIAKINIGLSTMGRIVGSDTNFKDITPDALAVALKIKKNCDDDIVLPLLELKSLVENNRLGQQTRLEELQDKLRTITQTVGELQNSMSSLAERMEGIQTNSKTLTQRSVALLQTSQNLLPTITQAEYEYFQSIKRLHHKCTQMEQQFNELRDSRDRRSVTRGEFTISEDVKNMDAGRINQINTLMRYEGDTLERIRERLATSEETIQQGLATME